MGEATQSAVVKPDTANAVLDDAPTVCAISILAEIISTMLHEGLGHAATAVVTLHASGRLTSLAWSSQQDSRLVEAGGTLVNLLTALVFSTAGQLRAAVAAALHPQERAAGSGLARDRAQLCVDRSRGGAGGNIHRRLRAWSPHQWLNTIESCPSHP